MKAFTVKRAAFLAVAVALLGCADALTGPNTVRSDALGLGADASPPTFPMLLVGVANPVITQTYAEFNDGAQGGYHTGIDIPVGSDLIPNARAVRPGRVVLVQENGRASCTEAKGDCDDRGFGNTVIIQHEAMVGGSAEVAVPFYTQYSHLRDFSPTILAACESIRGRLRGEWKSSGICRPDLEVTGGQNLGLIGNTAFGREGNTSPLPVQLHFEVKTFLGLERTSINTPECPAANGFGYNCEHPDNVGYIDPAVLFHATSLLPEAVEINAAVALLIGPGEMPPDLNNARFYRKVADVPAGAALVAYRSFPPTATCSVGWLQLRRGDGARFDDIGRPGAQLDAAWACVKPGPEPECCIAFSSARNGTYSIYSMRVDGSQLTRLTDPGSANDLHPRWSPDGNTISFTRSTGINQVWLMNADGTNQRPITALGDAASGASFSPNGSQLVYESVANGRTQLFIADVGGSNIRQLTTFATGNSFFPRWSPDGTRISFTRNPGVAGQTCANAPPCEVYVINAAGSGETRLTISPSGQQSSYAYWSPDGIKLGFERTDVQMGNRRTFTMNANGTTLRQITSLISGFDWSPDGTRIVAHRFAGTSVAIVVMNPTTFESANLTSDDPTGQNRYPAWKPLPPP
jgi:Tol biopolymer transport system component